MSCLSVTLTFALTLVIISSSKATAFPDGAAHHRSELRRPEVVPVARSRRLNLAARARSIEGRAVVVPSMVEVSQPSNVVVVTPSSVIPPVVLRTRAVLPKVEIDSDEENANVTVSHSFSVVSVKYSTAPDDLESPPPILRWGAEAEEKEERAESLSEFESDGGDDLGLPVTEVLDLDYQHVPEGAEEAEDEKGEAESRGGISSQDVTTEASAVLPAVLKVAEMEGFGIQKDVEADKPESRQDDDRYEVVHSYSSEPKLDQRAFELDYYVDDEDGGQDKEDGEEMELYEAEGNADSPYRGQFTGESEKVPKDAEASEEQSDGEQMAQEEKVRESEDDARTPSNESDELKVAPEVASATHGVRAPKAVEVRPPSASSSLLHRVILRLAKNQTYDVVKGTGPRPPFYPPLARHEQPPAFEFISVALHTTPVSPIRTTDDTSTTALSASSPATVDSATSIAESATISDDEFDERIYDAIINGENGLSSLAEGRSLYHGNDDFGYVEYDRDEADEIITINRAFENSDRETNRVNHQRARSEEVDVVEEESEDQVGSEPKQYARPTDSYYDVSIVIGIAISAVFFVIVGTVGLGAFIYHDRYSNKPQALDDCYANSDSGSGGGHSGFYSVEDSLRRVSQVECIGFDIPRDNFHEEMYSLDNDSFLNSLEAMTVTWPDYGSGVSTDSSTCTRSNASDV